MRSSFQSELKGLTTSMLCTSESELMRLTKSCSRQQKERPNSKMTKHNLSIEERFWPHVEKTKSCWNWKAGLDSHGYGFIKLNKVNAKAYRVAYELVKGPIPEGKQIDHLCRNRKCVNPDHLEPVTRRENILRGEGVSAINARKTHCSRGHEYTEENTYLYKGQRRFRVCKECDKIRHRKGNKQ